MERNGVCPECKGEMVHVAGGLRYISFDPAQQRMVEIREDYWWCPSCYQMTTQEARPC